VVDATRRRQADWVWPGDTSDTTVLAEVKADLAGWRLNRTVWVVDAGFTSGDNRQVLTGGGAGFILLRTSELEVDAAEIARGYKALAEVFRGWRDLKQLELPPVYHRKDERIVAHVQLSWLALLLIRTAEIACRDTWRNLSHELDRIQLHTYNTGAGTVSQRTRLTAEQQVLLTFLWVVRR
jgi:hypothetical protein